MLCVPAYTHGHRPYSATLYPTTFTLDSFLAVTICAQRNTHGLCFTSGPLAYDGFLVLLFVLGREGRRTYWAAGGFTSGHSNHDGSKEHKSRGLGEL